MSQARKTSGDSKVPDIVAEEADQEPDSLGQPGKAGK
jgi:hypothetical protein